MPVKVDAIRIFNKFNELVPVDWLLANRQDEVRMELDISVQTYVIASNKNALILNNTNGVIGDGWVHDDSNRFKDFRQGDTILYFDKSNGIGFNQALTIINKLDDGNIQFDQPLRLDLLTVLADDFKSVDGVFSVTTPITALRYKWNFIENNEAATFKSKIDGTEQELVCKLIDAASPTVQDMVFLGSKCYQTGSATAQGIEIDPDNIYTSKFKIVHYTSLYPFILSSEWDNLLKGLKASYFENNKCLKAIFDIKAATDYTNPNWIQQDQVFSILGNTGDYGENFNTSLTNYTVDSVVFKDKLGHTIPAIQLTTDETDVEIHIKNIIDSPFSDGNTEFELAFCKAPYDPGEYQGNSRTMDLNFLSDRAFQTVGNAAINGDQFGVSNRQILKNVQAIFISTDEIKITAKIAMLQGAVDILFESQEPRYIFSLAVQNHTLDTKVADLVRLPISIAPLYIDLSDDTLIKTDTIFYRHFEQGDPTEGTQALITAPEDEVVAYSLFYIDKAGLANDKILIDNLSINIKAKNPITGEEFTLDTFPLNMASLPIINGNQYVDFFVDRGFILPPTEIRKQIRVRRRSDLDNNNRFYYDLFFPFEVRWEYWEKLLKTSGDFFDNTLPNNGQNHDWTRYGSTLANWGVYYSLDINTFKNGVALSFNDESKFSMFGYDSNPIWDPNTIKSYDPTGANELFDGVNKFLLGYDDTLIKAEFTNIVATPDLNNTVVNMHIEVFEQGGINGARRMSSKWPTDGNTWFKSIDVSNEVVLSLVGNTIVAQVLVDHLKLPSNPKFAIMARLWTLPTGFVCICPEGFTFDPEIQACVITTGTGIVGKNGNQWAHGNTAGGEFNTTGHYKYVTSRKMIDGEGGTTISDGDGNLLFYSNGHNIWDANDNLVEDGMGNPVVIHGGPTSDESCLVTLKPGSTNDYYLYTISDLGGKFNLEYNILRNVTTAGGFIVAPADQNLALYPNPLDSSKDFVAESIQAFKNPDGSYWILTMENFAVTSQPNLVAIKLKTDGTFDAPVLSPVTAQTNVAGQFRINKEGTKIAKTTFGTQWWLYDFDSSTGQATMGICASGPLTVANGGYGFEFATSGDYVFISSNGGNKVTRFKIRTNGIYDNLATVNASALEITGGIANDTFYSPTTSEGGNTYTNGNIYQVRTGKLQMGPDGWIYCGLCVQLTSAQTPVGPNYIGVIPNPEGDGSGIGGCGWNTDVPLEDWTTSPKGLYDYHNDTIPHHVSTASLPSFELSLLTAKTIVPCGNVLSCRLPDLTIEPVCADGSVRITITNDKGKTWVISDNIGTATKLYPANDPNPYEEYGNYGPKDTVVITLTDNDNANCSITRTVTFDC